MRALQQARDGERRFSLAVAYLRQQPGPAVCESLLLCFYAGKPYQYDPFNATRFIAQGKLDPKEMVDRLRSGVYGAVQLNNSVKQNPPDPVTAERFAPSIIAAIDQSYQPRFQNEDGIVYLPGRPGNQMLTASAATCCALKNFRK
jgi:hypothetical protein